ncbi:hypothetical protein SE17_02275 [Kouleothrix aurantiaca]|uniref:Uncharacterized protein n=1 Tax=Kouleothrix aurantiaca TaxID=186479 RepID=A0A0P9DAM1_9CHLR|nr:hypothetical protein SE17_02275 [Kouleothrix aurantiaca]
MQTQDMFNQSDHDMLIRLASQLEAHSKREQEISQQTLAEVAKLNVKIDAMRESDFQRGRDIQDMKTRMRDDDLRIATLEQQVESLQDTAEKQQAIAEAMAKLADRRVKQWSLITGLIVFLISNGPTILAWLGHIFRITP